METATLTIVCAWCRRVVKMAATDTLVTHTICPACLEWTLAHTASNAGPSPAGEMSVPDGYFGDAFKS